MNSLINILLTEVEVKEALEKALQNRFIDNLRSRHPNVQLDSKLRGFVGELAFKKWMSNQGIEFAAKNVSVDQSGMDVDFIFETEKKTIELELKTSLLPDVDQSIEEFLRRRDIKLIRRNNQGIEALKADLHVQFVFSQLRQRKDDWLEKQAIDFKAPKDEIYEKIAAFRYCKDTYFVAWIDKSSLIKQIENKPKKLQLWKYGAREFWCCNLEKEAKQPNDLVQYLKDLKTGKNEFL